MAVNISASQLFSTGFLGKLSATLSKRSFPPEHLELELTESSVMQNLEKAREILLEIKALGVNLAIDDFGTGYSSLNHLAMLPFDVLKVARGFFTVLENNREHEAVFDGILTIARNLDIDVIVEGVETANQLEYFTKRGITLIQGYYFSQPLNETDLLLSYQTAGKT